MRIVSDFGSRLAQPPYLMVILLFGVLTVGRAVRESPDTVCCDTVTELDMHILISAVTCSHFPRKQMLLTDLTDDWEDYAASG